MLYLSRLTGQSQLIRPAQAPAVRTDTGLILVSPVQLQGKLLFMLKIWSNQRIVILQPYVLILPRALFLEDLEYTSLSLDSSRRVYIVPINIHFGEQYMVLFSVWNTLA